MEKVNFDLKYCYGINAFKHEFDFSGSNYIIYAPNGTMKTSFYKTVKNYINGEAVKDEFFPERNSSCSILDEKGDKINPDNLLVFGNDDISVSNDSLTSILADPKLKKRYDTIFSNLDKKYKSISSMVKKCSGNDISILLEDLKIKSIMDLEKKYFAMETVDSNFSKFSYKIFSKEDNIKILSDDITKININEYVNITNKIIKDNPMFLENEFELYNLKSMLDVANKQNYFTAGNFFNMIDNRVKKTFKQYDMEELTSLISKIEESINSNPELTRLNSNLTGKVGSIELNKEIKKNSWIIKYLSNLDECKRKYWNYILANNLEIKNQIDEYTEIYKINLDEINSIIADSESKENSSSWLSVTNIFNNRFLNLPFRLRVTNPKDVILKSSVCSIAYDYIEPDSISENVNKDTLLFNLSNGEKRALNILYFIFEIEHRIKNNINTVVIIDDIADSFDYKNKYAILEYLKQIVEKSLFRVIILTHNFDFYRLCSNRLELKKLAIEKDKSIKIKKIDFLKNVFTHFKDNLNKEVFFVSSIPFVRNIVELTSGKDSSYDFLTTLLHYKEDTKDKTVGDINIIFDKVISKKSTIDEKVNYIDLLFQVANTIEESNEICLQNKLCMSIACRIKLEKYLIDKINDWDIVKSLGKNQTAKLIEYCLNNELLNDEEKELCEKTKIMTSENIHINAFMYEPLIDMSDIELINLYKNITLLCNQ